MIFFPSFLLLQVQKSPPPMYRFNGVHELKIHSVLTFVGNIPIFGGQQGTAIADLGFKAEVTQIPGMKFNVWTTLTDFKLNFNKTDLPISLKDALKYFPKTLYVASTDGSYEQKGAIPPEPPVRLPGLSLGTVPVISFLPVRLSPLMTVAGTSFEYSQPVPGGQEQVKVNYGTQFGDRIALTFTHYIRTSGYEDAAEMVTSDPQNRVSQVVMEDHGLGSAIYSLKTGMITNVQCDDRAEYKVENLASHKKSKRHLTRHLSIDISEVQPNTAG